VVTVTSVGRFRPNSATNVLGDCTVGKKVRAVSCVVLIEQLNCVLQMNNLTQHVTQSAGCQLTASRDVTKCVVISNDEDFAA